MSREASKCPKSDHRPHWPTFVSLRKPSSTALSSNVETPSLLSNYSFT
jgi:hypothetical protein